MIKKLDKPDSIVAQLSVYMDDITKLRHKGYTWKQIANLVAVIDNDLGMCILKNTAIKAYYLRALKKLANGTLIVDQVSLTKGKRGPKPKIKQKVDNVLTGLSIKPNSIVPQLAVYLDDITKLRLSGYSWGEIIGFIMATDEEFGVRLKTDTINMYCKRAKKKLTNGTLVVAQKSLLNNIESRVA